MQRVPHYRFGPYEFISCDTTPDGDVELTLGRLILSMTVGLLAALRDACDRGLGEFGPADADHPEPERWAHERDAIEEGP